MGVKNFQKSLQPLRIQFAAVADDLKPLVSEHGISSGFVKSVAEIEPTSSQPLRVIIGVFVKNLKIQRDLNTLIFVV